MKESVLEAFDAKQLMTASAEARDARISKWIWTIDPRSSVDDCEKFPAVLQTRCGGGSTCEKKHINE